MIFGVKFSFWRENWRETISPLRLAGSSPERREQTSDLAASRPRKQSLKQRTLRPRQKEAKEIQTAFFFKT